MSMHEWLRFRALRGASHSLASKERKINDSFRKRIIDEKYAIAAIFKREDL